MFRWLLNWVVLYIKAIISYEGISRVKTYEYPKEAVNERLWESGLMDESDQALKTDKSTEKKILRWLKVDEASIEKIVK